MDLYEDVKLSWGTAKWNPEQYLRINSGVEVRRASLFHLLADHAAKEWKSEHQLYGCYQPRLDWRPLTDGELSTAVGVTHENSMHSTLQVFELPEHLVDLARDHTETCLAAEQFTPYHRGAKQITGQFMQPLLAPFQNWLFENICEPFDVDIGMGMLIRVNPPGRNSATGFELRGWDGLHIDHWGGNNWLQTKRDYNGSRFIMNAGEETRHLVFINLRLATIATRFANCMQADVYELLMRRDCPMTGLMANAFMEAFPNYPVLRVALPPRFGYISNSVAFPHDGYLVGKEKQDIAILMPHAVKSRPEMEEALYVMPVKYRSAWIQQCMASSGVRAGVRA
ncbi:MAG: hypothetical protein ACLP0B_03395 [Steroidobacteraceae bacterium]